MNEELSFKDCTPVEVESISGLLKCLEQPRSLNQLRTAFLLLLRFHYASAANYPDDLEALKCLVYDPDNPGDTTLSVEFSHVFDPNKTDNFPGVFVDKTDLRLNRHSMGNLAGFSFDTSREDSSHIASMRINITHVAKEAAVASDLAESTMVLLVGMEPVLRDRLGLLELRVEGVNQGQKAKDQPDRYHRDVVSVVASYEYAASVTLESHRIKKFAVAFKPEFC